MNAIFKKQRTKYGIISGLLLAIIFISSVFYLFGDALVNVEAKTSTTPVSDLLKDKSAIERAQIKAQEIAKLGAINKILNDKYDVYVKVRSIEVIEGGVQVFAQAWDKNNQQYGFGKNGSVDIERFRIINPPILVDDPKGSIKIIYEDLKGNTRARYLKEDLARAVIQVVAKAVKIYGKTGTEIRVGKIGNTISTYYATNDDRNYKISTPLDDWSQTAWDMAHNATSGTLGGSSGIEYIGISYDRQYAINRYFAEFPTTDLSGQAISVATLTVTSYVDAAGGSGIAANVYGHTASNPLVAGDYDQANAAEYATEIPIASWATSGNDNTFTLNASGTDAISLSSNTKFALRESNYDAPNSLPGNQGQYTYFGFYGSNQTGTADDPTLVITHALPPASLGYTAIISDIDYAPTGKPTMIQYGSGITTTYTYDAAVLYRLTSILTSQ